MIRFTPEAFAAHQKRLAAMKTARQGTNGAKTVKATSGPKVSQKGPKKPRTHVFPGLPPATCEFVFAAPRKWRFDWAWPEQMVALEQEGGVWIQGRHTRGKGYIADLEKYAEAACRGWLVIRATPQQIESGQAWRWVRRALDLKR